MVTSVWTRPDEPSGSALGEHFSNDPRFVRRADQPLFQPLVWKR
jgi:hypothetical protein